MAAVTLMVQHHPDENHHVGHGDAPVLIEVSVGTVFQAPLFSSMLKIKSLYFVLNIYLTTTFCPLRI